MQRHRRWISDEALADIGELLGLSPDEVDARATFYNLIFRQPVGRHVILVCDSFACFVMGYEEMRRHLEERLGIGLGETTADGRFTLLPIVCLGACHLAPAMEIDGELHGPLDARASSTRSWSAMPDETQRGTRASCRTRSGR